MSKKSRAGLIRALLLDNPDGMTVRGIGEHLGVSDQNMDNLNYTLKKMPDAYVDRWNTVGRRERIWCVVPVPEDCPPPVTYREKYRGKALINPGIDQMTKQSIADMCATKKLSQGEVARRVGVCVQSVRRYSMEAV